MTLLRRIRWSFVPLLTGMFVIASLLPAAAPAAYADSTVTVDPSAQDQPFEGWGTSLVWWANKWGGLPEARRTAMADAVFSLNSGLGFNIVRYNLGADGPDNSCAQRLTRAGPYTNIPSLQPTSAGYDWTRDASQRWMMQAAKARGANLFEAFVNSAPAWMLNNKCTAGATQPAYENISSSYYDEFASYIATVAKHFHDTDGITFRTVAPFNEPTAGFWFDTNDQEGMNVTAGSQNEIIKQVGAALAANGASAYTTVSAMDNFTIDGVIGTYGSYDATARGYLSQLNTHSYSGSNRSGVYQFAQQNNKLLWQSEWGDSANSPLDAAMRLGNRVTLDMKQLRPAAWIIWQAANSDDNITGDNVWGLVSNDSAYNLIFPPRYWAMAQFSKFIRPGYRFIDNNGPNTVTAYDANSGKLVIVTTNSSGSDSTDTYNLAQFNTVGSSAAVYRTSSTESLAQLANVSVANKSFSALSRANSITTYVISGVAYTSSGTTTSVNDNTIGTGANQFEYSGAWSYGTQSGAYQGDNHWSGATNDYYQVRFNGTQVKLYGARDPNHAIAAVSIDGGAEVDVDFYGTSRQDNTLLWTSALLTSGAHTLKVRVTGRKNASSGGLWFNADRVDSVSGPSVLSGTAIGAGGSWSPSDGSGYAKATDGNVTTFFDPATTPAWTGLDLGAAKTIAQIQFYPRSGFAGRMANGKFQGSSSASFSTGVVDLATIGGTPSEGQWTTINASAGGSFRYVRYIADPSQWCNVAEIKFLGS